MADEIPKLVISTGEHLASRALGEQGPATDSWELSSPIPGVRIINTWQVYQLIWLALVKDEAGHYQIFRSIDLHNYTLVHDHATEIYNLFWVDDGHMIFCATDGWWVTTNTGVTWSELTLGALIPRARTMAVVGLQDQLWSLVAYAEDHKIYQSDYPGGEWEEAYDTTAIWSDKWYPAIAGGPAGILAGAGGILLRSTAAGVAGSWSKIQDLSDQGVIKSIVVSNQSNLPVFLITIESPNAEYDQVNLSYDLGDSLVADSNRIGEVASVQAVTPTGTNEVVTQFAVLGKKAADLAHTYRIIE